jgi:hypothetical protein
MSFVIAPSHFEVDHFRAIFAGQTYLAEHGDLPDNPFWRAMERRRELNPARFSYWHPNISYLLEYRWFKPVDPPVINLPIETPQCLVPPPETRAQVAPEPAASTMLALALLAVGAWRLMMKES